MDKNIRLLIDKQNNLCYDTFGFRLKQPGGLLK